jgi:hypothetical protein
MVAWNFTAQSMDDRRDQCEHNGTHQARDKNGATDWRTQNDFAPSRLFGWIWLLNHDAPPPNQMPPVPIAPASFQLIRGQCGKRFLNHFANPWT